MTDSKSDSGKDIEKDGNASLRELFDFLDRDKSGSVTVEEIGYLMGLLKLDFGEDMIESLVNEIDTDGDGSISFEEFCTLMRGSRSMDCSKGDVMRAFRMFADSDAEAGYISKEALKNAVKTNCSPKDLQELNLDQLVARFDKTLERWIEYKHKIDIHFEK